MFSSSYYAYPIQKNELTLRKAKAQKSDGKKQGSRLAGTAAKKIFTHLAVSLFVFSKAISGQFLKNTLMFSEAYFLKA